MIRIAALGKIATGVGIVVLYGNTILLRFGIVDSIGIIALCGNVLVLRLKIVTMIWIAC